MKLTKPMLQAFKLVIHDYNTISQLSQKLHRSKNWISEVVSELEEEGFIAKESSFSLNKSRKKIVISNSPYALKLRDLMIEYKTIDFSQILSGARLKLLTSVCFDWKTIKSASPLAGISLIAARTLSKELANRGILSRQHGMCRVNSKTWHLLFEFLKEYRNFSRLNGRIKWKYGNEIIFEIDEPKLKKGVYTGFSRYEDYGIKIHAVKALCYFPEKKLSKEDIFVHSLLEIEDSRTLYLFLAFFLKNKLPRGKARQKAMFYDMYSAFRDFETLLDSKEEAIKTEHLPRFDRNEFRRIARMYGVKNV
ncbi:hypothetical protein HYW20_09180 [Candidatus Woesearchaeota archaeon]|nr:hypothetical protein [Candidatus Woesearchaeota archaeon]